MENYYLKLAENHFLETERLLLRPVSISDAEAMYEYASDEETTKYIFPKHASLMDTKQSIANYFLKEPLGKYSIVLKTNNKMIGTIDLRLEKDQPVAEIGFVLNKAYWGKGLVVEAGKALIALAFEELNLVRVFAYHDIRNLQSKRVQEKLGMTKEGTLRDFREHKGEIVTFNLYAMTAKDYQKMKKQ